MPLAFESNYCVGLVSLNANNKSNMPAYSTYNRLLAQNLVYYVKYDVYLNGHVYIHVL